LEHSAGGGKSVLGRHVPGSIETGRWYDVRVELQGRNIKCYLDGKLIHDEKYTTPKPLYAVSGLSKNKEEVIVKVVNTAATAKNIQLNLAGIKGVEPQWTKIVLTSEKPADENSLAQPTKVFPVTEHPTGASAKTAVSLPGNSVAVLRFKIKQ
jgi:alpha-L-arabinofuranosidase